MNRSSQGSGDVQRADVGLPTPTEGATYAVWWPFKRETFETWESDGGDVVSVTTPTWNPGWLYEDSGPEDTAPCWHGEGEQIRTVVSVHKPGHYPTRVFYTRQWRDPDGRVFGKPGLKVTTLACWRRWARGETRRRLAEEIDSRWAFLRSPTEVAIRAALAKGLVSPPSPPPSPEPVSNRMEAACDLPF